ncbi:AimR family lysis-lysogeny pheromone receptor [Bacillus thuringiensis]|uniref:AimR family lysis-lysogeny pheromone receptor n=1 Tax=Bacillus thuringiensis TaxID=1428 RepID=UPI003BF64BCA
MKQVEADMRKNGITLRPLAELSGIKTSTIQAGLSGVTKEMKLENFISIVFIIYENGYKRRSVINQFILLCEQDSNLIKSFLHCQFQHDYTMLTTLFKKHSKRQNIKKYLDIFEFYQMRNLKVMTPIELKANLDNHTFSTLSDCQALVNLLYCLTVYDIPNISGASLYSDAIDLNLSKVENTFIQSSIALKNKERQAYVKLLSNDVEESRHLCWEVIDSAEKYPLMRWFAYFCLGLSFQYECAYTAEKYLLSAIKVLEEDGFGKQFRYIETKTTLAYIYIENSFNLHLIEHEYLDIGEEAHFQLKFGDSELGERMYAEMEKKGELTSYRRASRAKVKNDRLELKAAMEDFEREGNRFFAYGIKKILLKDGVK